MATDFLIRGLPASKVARMHGVSIPTVYRVVQQILKSDEPGARTLQRLCEPEAASA